MPVFHERAQEVDDDDEEKKPEETKPGQEGQPAADMASADNALAVSIAVPQMGAVADITSSREF